MLIVTGGVDTRALPHKSFDSTEIHNGEKWTLVTPKLPSALQGHSLETVNNEVLLFGKNKHCKVLVSCSDKERNCVPIKVYSEMWLL